MVFLLNLADIVHELLCFFVYFGVRAVLQNFDVSDNSSLIECVQGLVYTFVIVEKTMLSEYKSFDQLYSFYFVFDQELVVKWIANHIHNPMLYHMVHCGAIFL